MEKKTIRSGAPFVFAGVLYYILNAVVAAVMAKIEKKMNYFR